MIYLLIHFGNVPNHIFHCIKQIHKVDPDAPIIFCGDHFIRHKCVFSYDINHIKFPQEINSYFKNERDPLWWSSFARVFVIKHILEKFKLPIIHFDNDVLIYQPFSEIRDCIGNELYITPHKKTEYTFGYSILNNIELYNELCNRITKLVSGGELHVRESTGDEIHEMRLLGYCGQDLIRDLPVHPSLGDLKGYIFDPSSYGQHIGGTPNGHAPGFIDDEQLAGPLIRKSKVYMRDNFPYIEYGGNEYKIFNLHMHNKKLHEYI